MALRRPCNYLGRRRHDSCFFTLAATACGVDDSLYVVVASVWQVPTPRSEHSKRSVDLYQCNPLTRSCRFLPATKLGAVSGESLCIGYVLTTCYDDSRPMAAAAASRWEHGCSPWRRHMTSGAARPGPGSSPPGPTCGLIQCSTKLNGDLATYTNIEPKDMVICHGAVYWLDHHRETTMVRVCHGHTHITDMEVAFCIIECRSLKCRPACGCCHAGVCR
jgi:hypothetical protein